MKKIALFLLLTISVLTTSAQEPQVAESKDGYATVYLYRDMAGAKEEVKILEHDIVWPSARNKKIELKVPAGQVTFYTKAGPEVPCKIVVNLVAGESYYVRNYFKLGFITGRSMVAVVPNDKGKKAYDKIKE